MHAVMLGGAIGVLAGWFWSNSSLVPVVRSESLAALPAARGIRTVSGATTSERHEGGSLDPSARTPDPKTASVDQPLAIVQPQSSGARDEGACGEGMRLVEGDYCATVIHRCLEPYTDGSGRCRRFAERARCYPPVMSMRYCIDEFEYPNRRGEKPQVMVSFAEAKDICESERKRLCSAREWTLACEGPERLPYPNGRVRDPAACNIDQPHRFPNVDALNDPRSVARELERLDQRTPSGSMPGCVSRFGVHDMVGNVDEWVIPDGPEEAAGLGAQTALKGGYFGAVRARCRPATPSHGPTFKFYQVGLRCCRDVAVK